MAQLQADAAERQPESQHVVFVFYSRNSLMAGHKAQRKCFVGILHNEFLKVSKRVSVSSPQGMKRGLVENEVLTLIS